MKELLSNPESVRLALIMVIGVLMIAVEIALLWYLDRQAERADVADVEVINGKPYLTAKYFTRRLESQHGKAEGEAYRTRAGSHAR